MSALSHLSAEARAECLGELPWGGLKTVAAKHGLDAQTLYDARHRHFGVRPPKSSRPIALPPAGCGWSERRKRAVAVALRRGEVTEAEVLARYAMTAEELATWRERYRDASAEGLETVVRRRAA